MAARETTGSTAVPWTMSLMAVRELTFSKAALEMIYTIKDTYDQIIESETEGLADKAYVFIASYLLETTSESRSSR